MLEWEELNLQEKYAAKALSEKSFMMFQRIWFNIMTGEKWGVNWHHKYIARIIEEIVEGKRRDTIFNIPPGAGKTEMLSIHAPIWATLKCPKIRNLNVSFSDSLAKTNSIRGRSLVTSDEFQELWPGDLGLKRDDHWQVLNSIGKVKAEIVSRSLGGQITGGRGGYIMDGFSGWIMLDDIDKPGDMFSDVKRKAVHNALANTMRSRRGNKSKHNPTPFISVQQRLHVDDSTAFLTDPDRGIGINFDVIKIPALINQEYIDSLPDWIRDECIKDVCGSEQREGYWSFWPSNEDIGQLFDFWERNEYTFLSQYMQQPIALGGNLFKQEWFNFYTDEDCPKQFDYRFITADTAQKTAERNDYSVICEWGYVGGNLYLLDMRRGKWEAPDLRALFEEIVKEAWNKNSAYYGNLRDVLVEDKVSGTGLIQDMRKVLPLPVRALQRSKDKLTRAMDAIPHVQQGKIYAPRDKLWTSEFVSEHVLFTSDDTHKNDDIVDNTIDAIMHAIIAKKSGLDLIL